MEPEPVRQTGRTTRLLVDAISMARSKKSCVFYLVPAHYMTRYVESLLMYLGSSTKEVMVCSPSEDKLQGVNYMSIFFDHTMFEKLPLREWSPTALLALQEQIRRSRNVSY